MPFLNYSDPNRPTRPPGVGSILILRIIWLALLLGPFSFGCVLPIVMRSGNFPAQPNTILEWVNLGMFVTVIPVAYLVRLLMFSRGWSEHGITITAYSTGNLIFWAGCESVAFFGLVVALVNGVFWPTIGLTLLAMGLQIATYPTGANMERH
jgi:hypothetical protein